MYQVTKVKSIMMLLKMPVLNSSLLKLVEL